MSVQGPSALPLPAYVPHTATRAGVTRRAGPAPERLQQAPADSSLWELLTDEERGFFSQQASLGALTYGRGRDAAAATPPSSAPIGQRLDVKG